MKIPGDSAINVNFHGLKSAAFSGTSYGCPTLSDTILFGSKYVEIRRNIKGEPDFIFTRE